MSISSDCQAVQVWCTQAERDKADFDEAIRNTESLNKTIGKGSSRKKCYLVIYISGEQPLEELTGDLLRHNI